MYIDAGTGSMALQAMAAVFFGMAVFWRQILNWFKAHLHRNALRGTR